MINIEEFRSKWELAKNAFTGSGGFWDGTYITMYSREIDEKLSERRKIAYYDNMLSKGLSRYIGFLFKQYPNRNIKNNLASLMTKDCNLKKDDINAFMMDFAVQSKIRGSMLCVVDMPSTIPATLGEQIRQRAVPFLTVIPPENVQSYILDKFGAFEYISYKSTTIIDVDGEKKEVGCIRYFDKSKWYVEVDGEKKEQGEYSIGVCPVVYFSEDGIFPCAGEFSDLGGMAKRLYNLTSEQDELLRSQTFSILTINAENPTDVEIKVSTDNAITYGRELNAPSYISPANAPTTAFENKIDKMEKRIQDKLYDITSSSSKESGIALEIKFQGLNASLSNFARRLNAFEYKIFDIVCKFLSIPNDIEVHYNLDFNIADVSKEIEELGDFKTLGYTLPKYEAEKVKKIISIDAQNLSQSKKDELMQEVDTNIIAPSS